MVEQAIWCLSVLNRYSPSHFSQVNRALNGVYYVASQHSEFSPWYNLGGKLDRIVKAFRSYQANDSTQEALSGLEKIVVTSEDIKKALLTGGSPATPEDLRKRFESLLNERCKGKDADKLRFVVE